MQLLAEREQARHEVEQLLQVKDPLLAKKEAGHEA